MRKQFCLFPIMKKIAPVVLISIFLLPLTVHSEIKAGSVEVSPFIGYNIFENRQNLENGPIFGGRLGYNFTSFLGIEATGEFIKSNVADKNKSFSKEGQFTSPTDDVNIVMYHLDLIYHFLPEGTFNPFIVAGYGAANYDPKINNKNMSLVDFGVGAKYWVADNIALRLDLRDNLVVDDQIHNLQATAGVVFRFGGEGKTAVTPIAQPADSDGDGVPDSLDKCPDTPAGVAVDKDGCPPVAKKVVILASEPKVEEKVVAVVAEKKAEVVVLAFEDVHFDFDKSSLTPEAKEILKRDIRHLKENPNAKIRVAGYTSAAGTMEYNQKLSERRAKAVQDYLISEGVITPDRLSTIGYGETHPAAYEAAPKEIYSDAAKANMRVLFEIVVE